MRGSFHLPYEMGREESATGTPDRFSGLAGIDPTLGVKGLKELDKAVNEYGFVGAHWYPHWFSMPIDAPADLPVLRALAPSSASRS